MGRTLIVMRSFFSSLISGTITLVFQGEGKTPVRRQWVNKDHRSNFHALSIRPALAASASITVC
jgi:hypothetical protein